MKKPLLVFVCLLVLGRSASAQLPGDHKLSFPNAPVGDVLAYYGALTGQQIICDNSVQGQISVQTGQPVTKDQAIAMIEEALFMDGFTMVDSEDGSMVKVLGLGRPVRAVGVPIYTSVGELPKRERVVSLVLHLEHADAQETAGFLAQYIPPNANTAFTPGRRSGVLLITGQTSLLRKVAKLVEVLDAAGEKAPPAAEKPDGAKPEAAKP